MIVLRNLTKTFSMNGHRKTVADNLNAVFPSGVAVGLLGRNGAGKSTLLKLIAGTSSPTWGEVLSTGSISFPVGLASSLHNDLTGAQNTRFVARIYGADTESLMDWVEDFAELGQHFHLPVRSYSSGMKGRLSFGINMGLAFDTYLIDEVTAAGDAAFKKKSAEVFNARMENAGAIFVSHSMGQVRELCSAGAMLENGKLYYYEDVEEAIERYMVSLDPDRAHPVRGLPPEERARTRFPDEARMLYGMGLPATHGEWVGDCLRRHRACHFGRAREVHYFDTRAGISAAIKQRRTRALRELGARFEDESEQERQNSLRLMGEMSDLLQIHAAPFDGPKRHDAYLDYMLVGFGGQLAICDFTPSYARLGEADFREMEAIGEATFCVTLRDPVDRLWEEICLELPPPQRSPDACAAAVADLAEIGPDKTLARKPFANYAQLYDRMNAIVPKARQVFLLHERLADPKRRQKELARLTDTLEIPAVPTIRLPDFPAPPELPPLDPGSAAALSELLEPQYAATRLRFGLLPEGWRDLGEVASDRARPGAPETRTAAE